MEPENANALCALGQEYYWTGQVEKSRRAFERVTAIDPKCSRAFLNLGAIYFQQAELLRHMQQPAEAINGRYATAYDYYSKAIEAKSHRGEVARAYKYRAELLRRWGRLNEAMEDDKRADEVTGNREAG